MANGSELRHSLKSAHAIKSRLKEGVVTYGVYDGSNRLTSFYEGPIGVSAGDPCLLTEFKYTDGAGGTSRDVQASRETVSTWPAIDFDALP